MVMMKTKLEAIANVAVILVALAVGYVALARYVAADRARPVGKRLTKIVKELDHEDPHEEEGVHSVVC